ncbi:hypothetical protein [Nocardioides sp. P5_C9_2]
MPGLWIDGWCTSARSSGRREIRRRADRSASASFHRRRCHDPRHPPGDRRIVVDLEENP